MTNEITGCPECGISHTLDNLTTRREYYKIHGTLKNYKNSLKEMENKK